MNYDYADDDDDQLENEGMESADADFGAVASGRLARMAKRGTKN